MFDTTRRRLLKTIAAAAGSCLLPAANTLAIPEPTWRRKSFRIGFGDPTIVAGNSCNQLRLWQHGPALKLGLQQMPSSALATMLNRMTSRRVVYNGSLLKLGDHQQEDGL